MIPEIKTIYYYKLSPYAHIRMIPDFAYELYDKRKILVGALLSQNFAHKIIIEELIKDASTS